MTESIWRRKRFGENEVEMLMQEAKMNEWVRKGTTHAIPFRRKSHARKRTEKGRRARCWKVMHEQSGIV